MKNNKVTLEKVESAIHIKYKKHINNAQLQKSRHVYYTSTIKSSILNTVGISEETYNSLKGLGVILFNPDNGKYIDIVISPIKIDSNQIKVATYVKEILDLSVGDELILIENNTFCFSNVRIQKIGNIKEDNIVISSQDISEKGIELDKFSFFQLFNYYTGESIIVKKSHIKIDASLKKGTILLNKKQRTFLGLELPKFFPDSYWNEIISKIPTDNIEDLTLLKEAYPTSDHFLKSDLEYDTKQKLHKLITSCCEPRLSLVPVIDSYCQKDKRGFKAISDFYVGKSTLSLLCRRPYESDEGFDIVRMSSSNMNLLGISEMDKVIIKYKDKTVRCRVLELDDEKAFFESNLPTPLNYAIGIPIHIRKKLGLGNINTAVKVDRDTSFMFKKSINEQIVPILLTLFSINLFDDPSIWKKALVSLLSIPIIVYLNLSSKRNMRG